MKEEQSPDRGWQGGSGGEEDAGEVGEAVIEPLTDKQLAEVQVAVDVFGMNVVKKSYNCALVVCSHILYPSCLSLSSFLLLSLLLFSLIPPPPSPPPSCSSFPLIKMESLYAKQFSVRERSLLAVQSILSSKMEEEGEEEAGQMMSRRDVATTVRATCQVLAKGFKDKVFSVSVQYYT